MNNINQNPLFRMIVQSVQDVMQTPVLYRLCARLDDGQIRKDAQFDISPKEAARKLMVLRKFTPEWEF